jgi:hypothetical protein
MSIDERDYYYDPKQFRNGNKSTANSPSNNDDAYFRKKAEKQQELIRASMILGIGIVVLVWLFGGEISRFLKSISLPHQQNEAANLNIPPIIPPHSDTPEQQFPESGSIIQYQQRPNGTTAKFIVVSAQGRTENCVVKLETWAEGLPVIEIFVRAGEQAETQTVPLGDYRAKIACGKRWYGRSDMFGVGTVISIGETPLKFWRAGNTTNGQILTLTKEINGNFKTRDAYLSKF